MNSIRFSFDWSARTCLWDSNGAMELQQLGISQSLLAMIKDMADEMQTALNWSDPTAPCPWTPAHKADFIARAKIAYQQLCEELNNIYEIVYDFNWFEQ